MSRTEKEELMLIKIFCTNPTIDNFCVLWKSTREKATKLSRYCLDNKVGDCKLAQEILKIRKEGCIGDLNIPGMVNMLYEYSRVYNLSDFISINYNDLYDIKDKYIQSDINKIAQSNMSDEDKKKELSKLYIKIFVTDRDRKNILQKLRSKNISFGSLDESFVINGYQNIKNIRHYMDPLMSNVYIKEKKLSDKIFKRVSSMKFLKQLVFDNTISYKSVEKFIERLYEKDVYFKNVEFYHSDKFMHRTDTGWKYY